MRELGEAELTSAVLAFLQLASPPLKVLAFWLARCNEKPPESCPIDVTKLSKTNQKLCRVATGRSTVRPGTKRPSRLWLRLRNLFWTFFRCATVNAAAAGQNHLSVTSGEVWHRRLSWKSITFILQTTTADTEPQKNTHQTRDTKRTGTHQGRLANYPGCNSELMRSRSTDYRTQFSP